MNKTTTDIQNLIQLTKDASIPSQLNINYSGLTNALIERAIAKWTMITFPLIYYTINSTPNYNCLGSLTINASSTIGQSIRIQITTCSQWSSASSFDEIYDLVFHATTVTGNQTATDGHSKFYGNGKVYITTSNVLRAKPCIFLVKQAFISGATIYSFYYHSGATSTGVARVSVDNTGFIFSNPMVLATLSTATDVYISLPIEFVYSTANPISTADLPWLAIYQGFNNYYSKTESDTRYSQIDLMFGSGFYLLGPKTHEWAGAFPSGHTHSDNLESYPLNVASPYLTIARIATTVFLDLSADVKTKLDSIGGGYFTKAQVINITGLANYYNKETTDTYIDAKIDTADVEKNDLYEWKQKLYYSFKYNK